MGQGSRKVLSWAGAITGLLAVCWANLAAITQAWWPVHGLGVLLIPFRISAIWYVARQVFAFKAMLDGISLNPFYRPPMSPAHFRLLGWWQFAPEHLLGSHVTWFGLPSFAWTLIMSLGVFMIFWGPAALAAVFMSRPQLSGERWPTLRELSRCRSRTWPGLGLMINVVKDTRHRWVYALDAGQEGAHVLHIARTGAGKTLWVTANMLTWAGPVVVNDLKQDIYRLTGGWRNHMGPVWVLNPTATVHRWDPAAHAQNEDDLRPILRAALTDPRERDVYWQDAALRLAMPLALGTLASKQNLWQTFRDCLHRSPDWTVGWLREVNPALADRFAVSERGDFPAAWATLRTRIEALLTPKILETMHGGDVDLSAFILKCPSLYIQIEERRLDDLVAFARVVWTSLWQQLTTLSDAADARHLPILCLLDEAGRCGIPGLHEYIVTVRSRKISVAILAQDLSQLATTYGRYAQTIHSSCRARVFSASEDDATCDHISRALGEAEEIVQTHSTSQHPSGRGGTIVQQRRFRPLMTPQALRCLQEDEVIAFLAGQRGARLRRLDWREHDALVGRTRIPAPKFTMPRMPTTELRKHATYIDLDDPSRDALGEKGA